LKWLAAAKGKTGNSKNKARKSKDIKINQFSLIPRKETNYVIESINRKIGFSML
jgi:hypothetical protein